MTIKLDPAFIAFAHELADAARVVTMQYFRKPLTIHRKADDSPVTIADRETEAKMRRMIHERYPEHGFYGEESGQHQTQAEWTWVIDPIDGTTSFSTGKPTFGTLIALVYQEQAVLGIIDHAALDDRWVGVTGQATLFNGREISCNQVQSLSEASAFTTTMKMFSDQEDRLRYQQLADQCKFTVFGADCLGYGLLASGFTEIVVEASLQPYDYLALTPVVEGAGGVITDWQGKGVTLHTGSKILASANQTLHEQALRYLKT